MPSVQNRSLTATGSPRSGSPPLPLAPGVGAPQVRVQLVAGRGRRVGVEVLGRGELARLDPADRLRRGQLEDLAHACGDGTRKAPSAGSGRGLERPLARQARVGLVGPQDVLERDDVRGRLDALEVERGDPVDVLEDPRQRAAHRLDPGVVELEPGEPGDVDDLLAIDHGA